MLSDEEIYQVAVTAEYGVSEGGITLSGLRAVEVAVRAECLEGTVWRDTIEEQRAYIKALTEELAAAQAVIGEAQVFASTDAYRGDDGVVDGDEVLRILAQSPTDALQAVKAAAWDEGYGDDDDCRKPRTNPYRKDKTGE